MRNALKIALGVAGMLAVFSGLVGIHDVPAAPLIDAAGSVDPYGLAYASLFVMVVTGFVLTGLALRNN